MRRALAVACLLIMGISCAFAQEVEQTDISYMASWPTLPTPYVVRNWNQTAQDVTRLALSGTDSHRLFPVSTYFNQTEALSGGYQGRNFGMSTYLRANNAMRSYGEGVAQLATILTAALTEGLDPRSLNGEDYVNMAKAYFGCTPDGRGFVSNNPGTQDCTNSFWYTLYPTLLYFHLAALYPDDAELTAHVRDTADTWLDAISYIDNWDMMGVSLKNKALVSGGHTEPEGVLGAAYVLLMAHARFGDEKYLSGALTLMRQASERVSNPYYEILGSYGPYIAARLNAEQNAGLPLARMLDWVFCDGTDSARGGWGIIKSAWGGYDAYGLSGSLTDTTGYAFAMNTFVTAGALAPVARYAPRYSRAIGRYLTAVASNSHMFFADGLPASLQDDVAYVAETGLTCLVYEGVRNRGATTPFATGDAKRPSRPDGTNFSFYSSGPLGLLSSMIHETDVPEILCFDLLKTDFEHAPAYPTYLLYNPLAQEKTVTVTLPDGAPVCVWDVVAGQCVSPAGVRETRVTLAPDSAAQLVLLPEGACVTEENGCLMCGDTVIRHADAWAEMPGVEESALITQELDVSPAVHTPAGDPVVAWRMTFNGREVASGGEAPVSVLVSPDRLGAGGGALAFHAETASGVRVCASSGVRALSPHLKTLAHWSADDLMTLWKPQANCKPERAENGVRLTLKNDWASFRCPFVLLNPADQPVLCMSVPDAFGGWGVMAFINGKQCYVQTDCAGKGSFLYDLTPLLLENGDKPAQVVIAPFITTGAGARVVFGDITIYGGEPR